MNGNPIWSQTYGDSVSSEAGHAVLQPNDDGYIIVGSKYKFINGAWNPGENNIWVIKMDTDGNESWSREYPAGDMYSATLTNDQGISILGEKNDDLWLLKINKDGEEVWNSCFGGTSSDEYGGSVFQTNDGGFIMTGSTWSTNSRAEDLLLIKASENGLEEWTHTFGGKNRDKGYSAIQLEDGSYVMTGFYNKDIYSSNKPLQAKEGDLWLIKQYIP